MELQPLSHLLYNLFDFDIANPEMGEGEFFLAVKRFIPDFKNLQGNAKVTLAVKRFPQQSSTNTLTKSVYNLPHQQIKKIHVLGVDMLI